MLKRSLHPVCFLHLASPLIFDDFCVTYFLSGVILSASTSPIRAPPLRSLPLPDRSGTTSAPGGGIGPFELKFLSPQTFGPGIPWAEVPSVPGVWIGSSDSAGDEDIALHLLNSVVPAVDRLEPVVDGNGVPAMVRSWLHEEALVCVLL